MDIAHHLAIGGIGAAALASHDQEVAGLAFLMASVLPDLDVAFMAAGKRAYLKNHQGPTHSLLLSPLLAGLISVPLARLVPGDDSVFLSSLAGLWIHIALDLSNTFGIALLWPLSRRRFCLDAVFFVDLTLWTMTLAAATAMYVVESRWIPWIYAASFTSYIVFKNYLQSHVRRKLTCDLAIPSSWHPFHFFILEDRGGESRAFLYNAASGHSSSERLFKRVSAELQEQASESPLYRDMQAITRHFEITHVEKSGEKSGDESGDESGEVVTIRARDLGIRNFGGKFARTTLTFDRTGKLVHEVADI